MAAVVALVLLVIIKDHGHYRKERERQEQEKKKRRHAEWWERHRVGVHTVKGGQVLLTPVPGATWWDQCHI